MFIGCVFSWQVWSVLLAKLQLQTLAPDGDHELGDWWIRQRRRIDATLRPLFDSLLLLVAWSLWKERNGSLRQATASGTRRHTCSYQGRRRMGAGLVRSSGSA